GKTLNFMGNEFGQLREWDEKRQQDWFLLTYPIQDAFYHYMKELNHIYQTNPALYQQDYDGDGFKWLDCQQEDRRVYVLQRRCLAETMIAVFNFSDYDQDYELKNLNFDRLRPMLHTDWLCWNGTEPEDRGPWAVTNGKLMIHLPRFSGILFRAENE
ncbi:MAG: glycogen-branching enzyme, partial [Clostridia bacterium]|nr:glycogen-branching enzyme [Clostridia bacterium]